MHGFWFAAVLLCAPLAWAGFPSIEQTTGKLWPMPQTEFQGGGSMTMEADTFSFSAVGRDCPLLQAAFRRYAHIIFPASARPSATNPKQKSSSLTTLQVNVHLPCDDSYPHLDMDEQYQLRICPPESPTEAFIVSPTIWGALRGLETFSQMAVPDGSFGFKLNCTQIFDYPRFSHRGVMLDTSRHFIPMEVLRQNLDLMAMNKFNVFHWHIVDDQSFPYQSGVYPDLSAKGAWSDIHVYTKENVADVVEYARNLGIRVIAEFDTPGHVRSWGVGQPGLLTSCYTGGAPDGSYGPIDPSKEENFEFLKTLFTEIGNRFPDHYMHLGGDEVPFRCWESNPDITDFMASLNITGKYAELEEYYISKLLDIVANLPTKNGYMVWQEVFDNDVQIAPDTVVHVWKDGYEAEMGRVTQAGYKVLLSSCWYLNYISYGVDWHKYYECDPQQGFNGTEAQKRLVMGGEACMWSEWVDATNLIARTWPRAAPVAEMLWSSANVTSKGPYQAAARLEEHRCRLLRRGYSAEPFGPSFCEGIL